MSPQERRIASFITGVDVKVEEDNDVRAFRAPRQALVRCPSAKVCDIEYAVGLPGRGRLLEDQRQLWEKLFERTGVERATVRVRRNQAAAGVPPKKGEEVASGAVIMITTCDRNKRPDVNWGRRTGAEIIANLCEVSYGGGGSVRQQEPIAPDDPAAPGAKVPRGGG